MAQCRGRESINHPEHRPLVRGRLLGHLFESLEQPRFVAGHLLFDLLATEECLETAARFDRVYERQYDTGAWAGSWPLDKATQAIRHNWINLPWSGVATDVAITERNTFSGRDGRLSAKTTTSSLGSYAFSQGWTYNALGQVTNLNYPNCTHATCTGSVGAAPARNLGMTYTNGWLTGITGFGELTYHSNGLTYQVKHGAGPTFASTDTQEKDLTFMRRPYTISNSALSATLGPYKYDGAGNITDVGNNRYLYDRVSRIKNFEFDSGQKQAYTYDVFGNLTGITTTRPPAAPVAQSFMVLGLTNRLSGTTYDGAGNQTSWGAFGYSYDAFGMMTRMTGSGNDNTHIYTADDERLWTMDFTAGGGEAGTVHTFRLRDADAKVLRELRLSGPNLTGNWSFRKDYVHRDAGRLLASVAAGNVINHFTLDHLGTPRLLTNNTGGYVSDHHYFAYGEELTPQTSDARKFTGHERDFNEGGGIGISDELDYLHARYCSPVTGRFLSVDPKVRRRPAQHPQLWNRYAVARGNPMKHVDSDGREGVHYQSAADQKFYEGAATRNYEVRAVLAAFGSGSGKDLNVTRGEPGKHPGPGSFDLAAVTDTNIAQTEVPQADVIEAYDKGGEAAAKQLMDSAPYELKEATIILSDQASDKDKLHELGHVAHALNDPEGFLQDGEAANQAKTETEYENTASERKANDFAARAAKKKPDPP